MKFNRTQRRTTRTKNHEGADAYSLTPKEELYAAVASTTLSDSFYEKADVRLTRIRQLIEQVAATDPAFVAKLAVYAREAMYLRSVPLVLTVELAKVHAGNDLLRRMTGRVIKRADEITELLAYYQQANGRTKGTKRLHKLSKQVQRGLADAFNRFDEYQFAKYNRATEVKLRDALFLVHPKAKNAAQQAIFDKIAADILAPAYTWERELSQAGQEVAQASEADKQAAFRARWETLVLSGKVGYMALLRNLRNLLQADVSAEVLQAVALRLADPAQVARSKQLPFRFFAAYRELEQVSHPATPRLLHALEKAMVASATNIAGFDEHTRVGIFTDVSGSMGQRLSQRSSIELCEVGLTLSCLFRHTCEQVVNGVFAQSYQTVQTDRKGGILANVQRLKQVNVGHSTNGYLAIDHLIKRRLELDKVLIFTDCQLWDSNYWGNRTISESWRTYQRMYPQAKLYLFDLAGYGNTPLSTQGHNVHLIAGWSDKVFDMLAALENGRSAVAEIERMDI